MTEKVKRFSLKRKEIPIEIEDESGAVMTYTLKELNGTNRDLYLTRMSKKMKMNDSKPAGISDFDGLQASLISLSLFDNQGRSVGVPVIQNFPASVQTELFNLAQELSGLDQKAEEEAKNDSQESD
jgi:hypothetical protein